MYKKEKGGGAGRRPVIATSSEAPSMNQAYNIRKPREKMQDTCKGDVAGMPMTQ